MNTASKDNRSYYDEFSDWYEKERHHGYHRMIDDLEFDLIKSYVKDRTVLEVGCGTGLILRDVEPIAKRAVGIDLSPGMLGKAVERGLEVVEGNATALPFPDNTFDVVYSFKVLAHVQDIDKALAEMARVTKTGGILLLEFYNKNSIRYLAKRVGGPQNISSATDEGAVYTRWDTPTDLNRRLPENLKLVDYAGVRVITPFAKAHEVPVLNKLLTKAEFMVRDSPLKHFGGFLVAILEKDLG